MSMNMQVTWLTDDTARIQAITKDFDENLYDPSSHEVKIYDPTGLARGTISSVGSLGTGTYYYDYPVPSAGPAGVWKVSWKVLSGTYPAREIINFMVSEG